MSESAEMAEFLAGLRQEFLGEATFLLEQCEESFLKLDDLSCRQDELAKIFRVAHTIKGSGAAVGFEDLATFAHAVEDCLSFLRTSPERLTTHIVTLLLRSGDALKERVDAYKGGAATTWDVTGLVGELAAATASLRGPAGVDASESPGFEIFSDDRQAEPAAAPAAAATCSDSGGRGHEDAAAPAAAAATCSDSGARGLEGGSFVPSDQAPAPDADAPLADALQTAVATGVKTDKAAAVATDASKKAATSSVKIDVQRIDGVLDLIGELVVIKSQLLTQAAPYGGDLQLSGVVSHLDKTVRELQDKALGMRMTPLKPLFLKLQRLVRDVALKLNKVVDLTIVGEDTEIDRTTVELLADPLMHIMRNAIDHGIETPAQRREQHKGEKAQIRLSAQQVGSRVIVKVRDDGKGIQRDKVLAKAIERGLVSREAGASMSDGDVYNLIFAPGFSTAEAVTDLSGRGVGLDVVRTNMQALKGTVEVSSTPGQGSTFCLSTPLTASITEGIAVRAQETLYILPIDAVKELLQSTPQALTELSNREQLLMVRGHLIPLMSLGKGKRGNHGMVVVVECDGRAVGLSIDAVLGQVQVVLKPVPEALGSLPGIGGVAVMGDGRVAMVVDISSFVAASDRQRGAATAKPLERAA